MICDVIDEKSGRGGGGGGGGGGGCSPCKEKGKKVQHPAPTNSSH